MENKVKQYHVRFHLKDKGDYETLKKNVSIEVLTGSLRTIDKKNIIVDVYIPARNLEELKHTYRFQILGDVDEIITEACKHVSKSNRFKRNK